jgi:hypothetical protein
MRSRVHSTRSNLKRSRTRRIDLFPEIDGDDRPAGGIRVQRDLVVHRGERYVSNGRRKKRISSCNALLRRRERGGQPTTLCLESRSLLTTDFGTSANSLDNLFRATLTEQQTIQLREFVIGLLQHVRPVDSTSEQALAVSIGLQDELADRTQVVVPSAVPRIHEGLGFQAAQVRY